MTLTELKYIVALARERHFGRAAQACFVSQPTLSVAIKKLEDELAVILFERGMPDIALTTAGEKIVSQAQYVLNQVQIIRDLAQQGSDPLQGPLHLGVIYTIGPYLLPELVPRMMAGTPHMPLILQENFTTQLLQALRQGALDCAVIAEPFDSEGLHVEALYDEPFILALPRDHLWATRPYIEAAELKQQTLLLLGAGHCLRDQVLAVCPEQPNFVSTAIGIQKTFEGSSLETIRYMVASGLGITVLPATALPKLQIDSAPLCYVPFAQPTPNRRVVLVSRKRFHRPQALAALSLAIAQCVLNGVQKR
ncbi:MAG: LysR family transcriptional regulator [Ottowia sp.]|nr:LysR family transcriptional regulator [Ottowia sp.]